VAKSKELKAPKIRDRIIELRRVRAADLMSHPENWRDHPESQVAVLDGILGEVGIADALLGFPADGLGIVTPDCQLMVFDGHARKDHNPNQIWPVLVMDLTRAEADKMLAVIDPVSAMAKTNQDKLVKLISGLNTECDAIAEMLAALAKDQPIECEPESATEELEDRSQALQDFIKKRQDSSKRGYDKADPNYWVCLVFQSWEQKQEFLFNIEDVPVLYGMYADGQTLASRVGIEVTPNTQKPVMSPLDKKLMAMVSVDHADGE